MIGISNDSGFHGYSATNLYPNYGGLTQSMDTVPDQAEQGKLTTVDAPTTPVVNKATHFNIWMILGVLVLLFILFGK